MRKSKSGAQRGSQNFVSVSEVSAAATDRTAKATEDVLGQEEEVRVDVDGDIEAPRQGRKDGGRIPNFNDQTAIKAHHQNDETDDVIDLKSLTK